MRVLNIVFIKYLFKSLIEVSCDWSGGFLFRGWGQGHQVHFYIRGISASYSSTGKLNCYFFGL